MPITNPISFANPYVRMRDWIEHNYWYTASDNIPKSIIEKVLSDENTFLLVCNEFEASTSLLDQILELGIPREKIVLISENADLEGSYYWACAGEMTIKLQTRKMPKFDTLEKKIYNKSFLNFNRRWRLHRPCFVALLKAMDILDHGLISLSESDDHLNWNDVFEPISDILKPNEILYSLFTKNKSEIINIPKLHLDTIDLLSPRDRIINTDIDITSVIKLYQESYFSVVSETYFFETPGRFLTEKTFKAIGFKHPFILIAQPRSLELLHDMGYQSFHPYINESYDAEVDNLKRLKLILDEVVRLASLDHAQVCQFIDNVKPIAEYNLNLLLTKTKHIKQIG